MQKWIRQRPTLLHAIVGLVGLVVAPLPGASASAAGAGSDRDELLEQQAFVAGFDAYTWGFIYVKSMLLRDEAINPGYRAYSPINSIHVQSTLAKPGFTDFTPNNDTLYGLGWLDLSQGPILMTVPESDGRYWVMQATDYGLNCLAYVGSRVGSRPGVYAYARSDWQGELPAGVTRIDSRSDTVFLQLRTYVEQDVEGDLQKVVKFNRAFSFEPLDRNAVYRPVARDAVIRDVKNTNPDLHNLKFFALLNEAVTREPPLPGEEPVYAQFARYGIGPGRTFDPDALTDSQRRGLQKGIDAAARGLALAVKERGRPIGGNWRAHYGVGQYGFDFEFRSMVAYVGYGGNEDIEAMYPVAFTDDRGKPLSGSARYRIHFDKGGLPPVDAFWSITAYTLPDNQLVENELQRYNINPGTRGLRYEKDGSLDIYIQHDRPSDDRVGNWLPAPGGAFWLILRMYNPRPELLEGRYTGAPTIENIGAR
jgi:hypothetical protein